MDIFFFNFCISSSRTSDSHYPNPNPKKKIYPPKNSQPPIFLQALLSNQKEQKDRKSVG